MSFLRSNSFPTSRRAGLRSGTDPDGRPPAVRRPLPFSRLGALVAAAAAGPARTAVVVVGTRMPINVAWISAMVGLGAGSASSIRSTNSTTGAGRVVGGSRSTSPVRAATPAYLWVAASKGGSEPVRYSA